MTYPRPQSPFSKPFLFSLLALACLTAGCTRQQGVLPNYQEDDIRERHLMKQQSQLQKLSIIPIGPNQDQISPYDTNRIIGFVENYKLSGLDHLTITYHGSKAAEPTIDALLNGLNETRSKTKSAPSKPGSTEIIFSYAAIQTVLDRNCEGSRTDGGMTLMVPNKTMGCAYSVAFAQQVDQPRDLVDPRQQDKKYYLSTIQPNTTNNDNSTNSNSSSKATDAIKSLLNLN